VLFGPVALPRAAWVVLTRLGPVLRPAREPGGPVLPVVRDKGGAQYGQEDAGGPMVDPLAAEPDAATNRVVTDETITVCPWRLHCVPPHYP
jgi:hypothetical protein